MYEDGGEEHLNSQTAAPASGAEPVSLCPEEAGEWGLLDSGAFFRRCAVQVWVHRAGALRNLSPPQRHTCWYAQLRGVDQPGQEAGPRLGLGQILLLSKNTTVHGCVLLRWLHLADWLLCDQYLLITASLGGRDLLLFVTGCNLELELTDPDLLERWKNSLWTIRTNCSMMVPQDRIVNKYLTPLN